MTATAFDSSDAELVARLRRGDDRAFDVLYARHSRVVAHALRRFLAGTGIDAEGVAQETFLSAYRALPGTTGPMFVRSYLLRIARNRALDALAHDKRHAPRLDAGAQRLLGSDDGVEGLAERREELARIVKAVSRLPERQRRALVLGILEGRSMREVAERLDTSVGGVKSLLLRARAAVREQAAA